MPILCKVHRGDFIESMHVGFVVVVDAKGEILYSNGDAHYLTCVRSSLKPFQASASVKAGATKHFNFTKEEIFIKDVDYYYSNSIARASKTMSECRSEKTKLKLTGTEG